MSRPTKQQRIEINERRRNRYHSDPEYRLLRIKQSNKPVPVIERLGPFIPIAEKKKMYMAKWKLANREMVRAKAIKHYYENRESLSVKTRLKADRLALLRIRKCRHCDSEFIFAVSGKHRKFCSDECLLKSNRQKNKAWRDEKKKDIRFRIYESVRGTLRDSLTRRRIRFGKRLWPALGYTAEVLRSHLESFFSKENGFTWSNYGSQWHIDHVIPQLRFDFESIDDAEFKACWSLSN